MTPHNYPEDSVGDLLVKTVDYKMALLTPEKRELMKRVLEAGMYIQQQDGIDGMAFMLSKPTADEVLARAEQLLNQKSAPKGFFARLRNALR